MRIVIVGAGRIGSNLAKSLSDEDHEVFLIEKNEEIANKADEQLDVKVIIGSGTDPERLKDANVEHADLVIAVTLSDEINLVVCSLAAAFGAKRRIARVRNSSLSQEIHRKGFDHFEIHEIINPEEVAASAITSAVEAPGTCEVCDFADGQIYLRAFDVPERSPLSALSISDFRDEDFPWPFLVVAILRNEEVIIPKGDTRIQANDRIYVLLPSQSLGEFLSFVDPSLIKPKKVIIYGATVTGIYVAKVLAGHIKELVLIEEEKEKAEKAAGELEGVCVIQGSGSEKEVLKEAGIEVADIFIATSQSDHYNLISAVLAKKMGAKHTIITTHRPDYVSIVDALNIDIVISPHLLAVDSILAYVRGESVSAVTKIADCDAEAVEFLPEEGSPITKGSLKDLSLPKDSIVGAVCKPEGVVLARGETQISAGEKVIVFCKDSVIKKLRTFFTKKKTF